MAARASSEADRALIDAAHDAIARNYDAARERHTVGAAVRCASGNVHVGVNVYAIHGACAEYVALGAAITAGEREFVAVVAVRGADGELLPPCGNCRQLLLDYAPDCDVLLPGAGGPMKVKARELLPAAYRGE